MAQKQTLKNLIDDWIREFQRPFTTQEFVQKVEKSWQKKISKATLGRLRKKLSHHEDLIGTNDDDFLPYRAVIREIRHLELAAQLGNVEWEQKIFVPGHRMIPFLSPKRGHKDLVFFGPDCEEICKEKRSFPIDEVAQFFHYSGDRHFPDEINVNEWMPIKSSMALMVWDMRRFYEKYSLGPEDGLRLTLLDYEAAIFQVFPYKKAEFVDDQVKRRNLHVGLENALSRIYGEDAIFSGGLQKQLLHGLFSLDSSALAMAPFSLTHFLESIADLTLVNRQTGGMHLAPAWTAEDHEITRKQVPRIPKGATGSLKEIFEDLGLAFQASEFKAILYAVMASDKFKIESVFHLLFGGEGKLFLNEKQHKSFYSLLRKLLKKICEDLKEPEPKLVSELRERCVEVKLNLIAILRYVESKGVSLENLPSETLVRIVDLDQFCIDNLTRLSERGQPVDIKFIGDLRLSLKMVLPQLGHLEDEVYGQLGFY